MQLFEHQKRGLSFLAANGYKGLLKWDCGTGKTLASLAAIKQNGFKALVVCPKNLIEDAWLDDAKKIDITATDLTCRKPNIDAQVHIINYEALISKKGAEVAKNSYDIIIIDESSRLKNFKSKTTKKILEVCKTISKRILLSATPAPNNDMELWAQALLSGAPIPNNFFSYRSKYFHISKQLYFGSNTIKQYDITPMKKKELYGTISCVINEVKKDECLDLPPITNIIRTAGLNTDEFKYYSQMKKDLVAEIGDDIVSATTALAKIMKLRQITSGFMIGEKVLQITEKPTKLEILSGILEELGERQVIVWLNFNEEQNMVQKMLEKEKISYSTLYGATDDRRSNIDDFKSGKTRILLASPQSAAHGLTLVNSADMIFFSMTYSYELYHQACNRTHRPGQKNPCTNYHIIAKGTVDEDILKAVQEKKSNSELLSMVLKR